jgi:Beta-propeller domains of methanol dehydrogenase type
MLLPGTGGAAIFPEPLEDFVNDYAHVLTSADAAGIRGMLQSVRAQTGAQMTVVTVDSLAAYADPGQTLESYATALFNQWGVGREGKDDGILVLFALTDRKVRIELGSGYGSRYDAAMREVIETRIVPYFRDGAYSRGLYEGTRGAIEGVTRQVSWLRFHRTELILVGVAVVCILAGISCIRSGKKGWGWVFFTVAGTLLLSLLMLVLFRRKRGKGGGFGGGRSSGGGASGSW